MATTENGHPTRNDHYNFNAISKGNEKRLCIALLLRLNAMGGVARFLSVKIDPGGRVGVATGVVVTIIEYESNSF